MAATDFTFDSTQCNFNDIFSFKDPNNVFSCKVKDGYLYKNVKKL